MTQGGTLSSCSHSLAGMTKTSTCVPHVTALEGCCQTSTCVLHVTDRDVCRGASSRWEGRTELRRKRGGCLETALVLLMLLVRWGACGIWSNHAAESML